MATPADLRRSRVLRLPLLPFVCSNCKMDEIQLGVTRCKHPYCVECYHESDACVECGANFLRAKEPIAATEPLRLPPPYPERLDTEEDVKRARVERDSHSDAAIREHHRNAVKRPAMLGGHWCTYCEENGIVDSFQKERGMCDSCAETVRHLDVTSFAEDPGGHKCRKCQRNVSLRPWFSCFACLSRDTHERNRRLIDAMPAGN